MGLGIEIEDWGLVFGIGNWDWGLGISIGDGWWWWSRPNILSILVLIEIRIRIKSRLGQRHLTPEVIDVELDPTVLVFDIIVDILISEL